MTKIPSIENTDDFIFRIEIKKGSPPRANNPALLVFELFSEIAGTFHSVDVIVLRDGQRTKDVEFQKFEQHRLSDANAIFSRFEFNDNVCRVEEHDYLLTVILRYLTSTS